jgi:hypothetical protein
MKTRQPTILTQPKQPSTPVEPPASSGTTLIVPPPGAASHPGTIAVSGQPQTASDPPPATQPTLSARQQLPGMAWATGTEDATNQVVQTTIAKGRDFIAANSGPVEPPLPPLRNEEPPVAPDPVTVEEEPDPEAGATPGQINWVNDRGQPVSFVNDKGEPITWTGDVPSAERIQEGTASLAGGTVLGATAEILPAADDPSNKRTRRRTAAKKQRGTTTTKIKIRSYPQAIAYCQILIGALQEIVDYNPLRHHNQPPPDLRIEDKEYLQEIRRLIAELRTLNDLLAASRRQPKRTSDAAINLSHHFNTFLNCVAKSAGYGTGTLLVATMASLLSELGIAQDIIMNILQHAKRH